MVGDVVNHSVIEPRSPYENRIVEGLARAFVGNERKARNNRESHEQRTDQGIADNVSHGGEELFLHALEGKERKIGRNDDQGSEKNGPCDLNRRFTRIFFREWCI